MKFDKELVLKHKFWALLAVSLPLIFGAIFLLTTSVSGDIIKTRTDIEKKIKDFSQTNIEIKTPAEIAEVRRIADMEDAKKKVVHAKAFQKQEPLFMWPERVESEFNFRNGLFAQKITIKKGDAAGETPKDEERLVHGTIERVTANVLEVLGTDKKTKYSFFRTTRVLNGNAVEGDDPVKEVTFPEIRNYVKSRVSVAFHRGKYFNEPLTDSEQDTYKLLNVYLSQIDPILAQVQPMDERGEGVVQLKGWTYKKGELPPGKPAQRFLTYLDQGWVNAQGDISEEAWLAQEDLWIQQELYRLVRLANDYVSRFKGEGGADKNKSYTFKNPFWEIGVKWPGGNKLLLSLKNLQNRRQKLDLSFLVRLHPTQEPEKVLIGGEPLGPVGTKEATRELSYDLKEGPSRKGVYGLDQVLTWETAAVKRIDQITIGSLSPEEIALGHRMFPEGQQLLKKADPSAAPANAPPTPFPGRGGLLGGPAGAGGANDLSPNGLIKNRYLEGAVTAQSRRIPVALALIVDQDHIDRVQTAFSNSNLRFLTTQVLLNRYPGSLRPQIVSDTDPAGGVGPGPVRPVFPPFAGPRGPLGPVSTRAGRRYQQPRPEATIWKPILR